MLQTPRRPFRGGATVVLTLLVLHIQNQLDGGCTPGIPSAAEGGS